MRRILIVLLVLAVGAAGAVYFFPEWTTAPAEPAYRFAKVDRGPIVAAVNASGAINPTTTVIVGSQLSGQVVEILADYNDEVKADQVVARLNSDQIRARLDAARADLEQMRATKLVQEAQIQRVLADIERAKATQQDADAQIARNEALLADAERLVVRQQELRTRGVATEASYDTARAQRDAQKGSLDSSRAQLASAKAQSLGLQADLQVARAQLQAVSAQILQREATVRQIEVDLHNTEIKSPVNGTIVQRNVELGATVAASLQAPTLFLIADDLRHMEIAANIDETDVGRVRAGQKTSFTVNAYPGRTFEGTVKQVRLGSLTVQNVVIYTTIISIENPNKELLPGMTANLRIETDVRENALRMPNAALRWRPPGAEPVTAQATAPRPEAAESGPQRGDGEGGRRAGAGGGGRVMAEYAAALKTDLSLSADQQKEIDAILADVRKAMGAMLRGEQDPAARREAIRTQWAQMNDRVGAALKNEQRGKFDEIRERFVQSRNQAQRGRVYVLAANGKPEAVDVRIGVGDGGTTEVITSRLEPGAQVIIGGGPRTAEAAAAAARSPRFGF